MAIWTERRVLGRMQTRPGPNVNGFLGIPQLIADAAKLIMKEDFWLKGAEKFVYILAPVITAFSLRAADEARPQLHALGPQGKGGGDPAPVRDAAGGDDG